MSLDGHWILRRPDFIFFFFLPPLKLTFTFLMKQICYRGRKDTDLHCLFIFCLVMTHFFHPFLNTGQEIPCSGRAACVPIVCCLFSISIGYKCLICLVKKTQLSEPAHWPSFLPVGAGDLFMVTAITAYIN